MGIKVELKKLFDKKISVVLNDREVCIIPARNECGMDDLQEAFEIVVDHIGGEVDNDEW